MSVPKAKVVEGDEDSVSLHSADVTYEVSDADYASKAGPKVDSEINDVTVKPAAVEENDYKEERIADQGEQPKRGKQKRRTLGSQSQKKKKTEEFVASTGPNEITTAIIKSKGSKVFTPERDEEIRMAVARFGTKWELVLDYLKYPGVTKEQYQKRYAGYLSPEVENREKTPWSVELEKQLTELVLLNTGHMRNGREVINWKKISKQMNRQYFDCQNRWNTLRKGSLNVGRFTAEEDDLIVRTHNEWTGAGKGLWVTLEKMLNRRNDVIRKRYNLLVAKAAKAAASEIPAADI